MEKSMSPAMDFGKKLLLFLLLSVFGFCGLAQNYNAPESVVFDAGNNRYLISNVIGGAILERNSSGVLNNFVTGLTQPKGLAIVGNAVYVSEPNRIKGYNLSNGSQVFNLLVTGSSNLNDIAADATNNRLFVSDLAGGRIYEIDLVGNSFTQLVSVTSPNGVLYDAPNNRLIVCTWSTNAPIREIDLSNNSVSTLVTTPYTNLDGLARDASGNFYVSSWGSGTVYRYNNTFSGAAVAVSTGHAGPADIFYNLAECTLVIPNFNSNTVSFNTTSINIIAPPTLSCFGDTNGALSAIAAHALAPLTYSWSNGSTSNVLTNLPAGVYTVTLTDNNGCTAFSAVTINQPPQLTVAISGAMDVSCFGGSNGSAIAQAMGGTPGYTYFWSNGFNGISPQNLSGGSHTVTVTDNFGCTDSASVIIQQAPALTVSTVVNQDATCPESADGEAEASASGGTGNITYQWSSGGTQAIENGLNPGTFTVTATDANGCTGTSQVQVVALNSGPSLDLGPDTAFCMGDTTILDGGMGFTNYQWSTNQSGPSIEVSQTGTYSLTVTDGNGCTTHDSVVVTFNPLPLIDLGNDTTVCSGFALYEFTLTPGPDFVSYLWSNGSTDSSLTFILDMDTAIHVTVVDSNGCSGSDTIIFDLIPCPGIGEYHQAKNVLLYPNPAEELVNLKWVDGNTPEGEIQLWSVTGRLVRTQRITGEWMTISLSGVEGGIYFLQTPDGYSRLVVR